MSRGVNKVFILGFLGRDPEMRYSQDGNAIANLSVATSQEWKDRNGEKKEKTEWHRVVAFKRLAEICGQYLSKGKQVYIEGRLQTRSWEQNGETKYITEIVALELQMLGGGGGSNQGGGYGSRDQNQPQAYQEPQSTQGGGGIEEDLPF